MPRVLGVHIPDEKIEIALTYVYGIGELYLKKF